VNLTRLCSSLTLLAQLISLTQVIVSLPYRASKWSRKRSQSARCSLLCNTGSSCRFYL